MSNRIVIGEKNEDDERPVTVDVRGIGDDEIIRRLTEIRLSSFLRCSEEMMAAFLGSKTSYEIRRVCMDSVLNNLFPKPTESK